VATVMLTWLLVSRLELRSISRDTRSPAAVVIMPPGVFNAPPSLASPPRVRTLSQTSTSEESSHGCCLPQLELVPLHGPVRIRSARDVNTPRLFRKVWRDSTSHLFGETPAKHSCAYSLGFVEAFSELVFY
jgi:hypothetical protein